ncbi:MAG: Xaa-Pro peptidase family protein [Aquisalimonadaceae bacterium]
MASAVPFFSVTEFEARRQTVRARMGQQGLDAILVASPENIYYLCGLDHMGYFAYQLLVMPARGEPILITRAMERATVRDQVPGVRHVGYPDGSKPTSATRDQVPPQVSLPLPGEAGAAAPVKPSAAVDATCETVRDLGLGHGCLGLEKSSTFLPFAMAEGLMKDLSTASWVDVSGLVDDCRITQSPRELECTRKAADISDSMMLGAIAAAGKGVYHREIMAAIYDALFRRGGTYPGFVPLVRSTGTLDHEHGTWQDVRLRDRDVLFLEMAGCVRRYHAPVGRLVYIGRAPRNGEQINSVCRDAQFAAAQAIRPGVRAGDVYEQWQTVLERAGLASYRRHHCGYSVGIGYPPSWSGSGVPVGLRPGSDLELREGMVFHLMSWLLRSSKGDAFLSDTVVVTADGCEWLTTPGRRMTVR